MAISTIIVKTLGDSIQKERIAAAAISPGHLIETDVNGKFAVQSTIAIVAARCFAIENMLAGDGIGVNYAADDQVFGQYFQRGEEVFALVAGTAGAIVIGDLLQAVGDGTLKKVVTTAVPLAIALQATSADERIVVEIL